MWSIDELSITNLLRNQFDARVSGIARIGQGMFAQAFSFQVDAEEYIIRCNRYEEDFLKDAFASDHFSSHLPIPKMIRCGRFNQDYFFAITERCQGQTLVRLEKFSIDAVLPRLFDSLHALHSLDTSEYSGWGLTDGNGQGRFASWAEYLRSFYNQKFVFTWEELFDLTVMEREIHEKYSSVLEENLPYCTTKKYWVHGDFGYDNVICDDQRITGVLDWAELRLGDFVYDIAYLEFWTQDVPYQTHWQVWAAGQGLEVDNFDRRMQCYFAHIGLASLAIAAIHNDGDDYDQVKARMQRLIIGA